MARHALFEGLVVDEWDRPVEVVDVGGEAYYVVDDDGFRRHIESEQVDRQVLEELLGMIEGHEEIISRGTMEMIGQEDIFTKALIERSLATASEHIDEILERGLPEAARLNLGMVGFRVVVDVHGQLLRIEQPTVSDEDEW